MSSITRQRGAIAITLDRPRLLFFDMNATWKLVDRYGIDFAAELYTVKPKEDGKSFDLTLKSAEALRYFLWVGLYADDPELTEEHTAEFIRPWTLREIFYATVRALTGAMESPVEVGKAAAAGTTATPSAKRQPSGKASTSQRRRGSR